MAKTFTSLAAIVFLVAGLIVPNCALGYEIEGSGLEVTKRCVKSLIEAELRKSQMKGIEITEVSIPLLPPLETGMRASTRRYPFVGLDQRGTRYTGRILADVYAWSTRISCHVASSIRFHRWGCSEGCPTETFELSAQLLRYSGDKLIPISDD